MERATLVLGAIAVVSESDESGSQMSSRRLFRVYGRL